MKTELRYYSGLEVRGNGQSRIVTGYALKFGVLSQDLGGFIEIIDSRALDDVDLSDVVALFNHDHNWILARTSSNTLKLSKDSTGLRYEFDAPNTSAGNDLLESVKRGDVTGSSFSFIIAKGGEKWDYSKETPVRTITKFARIIDVSPVVWPAYKESEVYSRMQASLEETRSLLTKQNINIQMKKAEKRIGLLDVVKQSIRGDRDEDLENLHRRGLELARTLGINTNAPFILPLEARTLTAGQEGNSVGNDVMWDFLREPFRSENVLVKAGAVYIPNVTANFSVPKFNGCKVNWAGEIDEAEDGSNTFGKVSFSPKRLTATISVSKMLIIQTEGQAEELIKTDIVRALTSKIESTVFGKHVAYSSKPGGFFTGATDSDLIITGAPDRGKLINLEFTVKAPRDKRAFIINEAGAKKLKSTVQTVNGTRFILEGGMINDNVAFITDHIPGELTSTMDQEGIVYGNFSDYLISQFGLIDIIVDPFTKAQDGAVEITVNCYVDMKPRNDEAFAIGSILP